MNDVQRKMLQLLDKFDRLCREFDITYYLGGGTALGAIRHGGFLPWDDDADLYMSRDNYLKLLAVQDDFFSDDFVLVNSQKYSKYKNTLIRCVDTNSTAITKGRIVDDAPKGEFIEIFILDPMPKDPQKQEEWKTKHWIYAELHCIAFRVANTRITHWTDKKVFDEYKEKCEQLGKEAVLRQLEEDLFTIPEEEAEEYCSRWGFRNLVYDISWFKEPRYVPFEDKRLPVATEAEKVLRFDYGDSWMDIPNIDNQISHDIVQNMDIGYQHFVDDYSQFVDAERVYSFYEERKEKLIENYFSTFEAAENRRQLKEVQVTASLAYHHCPEETLEQLLKEGRPDEVKDHFSPWYKNQFEPLFWGVERCIDIDDSSLYYALLPLLLEGGYSTVRKLLLWRQRERALSEKLQLIFDYVDGIRDAYIAAYDNRDYPAAGELLQKDAVQNFPYKDMQLDYHLLQIKVGLECGLRSELPALEQSCKKWLAAYPEQGELLSYCGDILYAAGQRQEAADYYKDAYEHTRNAFIRKHIEERIDIAEAE